MHKAIQLGFSTNIYTWANSNSGKNKQNTEQLVVGEMESNNTDKKRDGRCPLLLHFSSLLSSLTLVRSATLPSLEQAIHVPPSTASLPPKILLLSSHQANGAVPLKQDQTNQRKPSIIKSKWKEQKEEELNHVPVEIFVSVEQEEERVAWVTLPHERRYTHFSEF